jgi:nucleotide-binding universal stress UspA family protein/nitrite reductase/ring-hydroxylating ferredoxin subunit
MIYDTILVGTDGSATAAVAEGVALALAKAQSARVVFAAAYRGDDSRAREAVEAARDRAAATGVAATTEMLDAEPSAAIVELADRADAQLIVVGDVGMGPARRFRLGGVPDQISHDMPCDLLIVRTSKGDRTAAPGTYRRVLIATDGSATADRAARVGAAFGRGLGAAITFVHVGDETVGGIVLRDTAERLAAADAEMKAISGGDAGERIVEVSRDGAFDLVVVGNKGMSGSMRFLLGAVPDRVAHQVPCDVLIVNTAGRSLHDLEPGEGAIVEVEGTKVAAYREESGAFITLSPKCKHMGCTVGWNHRAKSWDCPCHGSRYERDGSVRNGPTRHPLDPVAAPPNL